MNLALEPLVNRRCGFPPQNSLLMPAFSLPRGPPGVTPGLRPAQDAPLPSSAPTTPSKRGEEGEKRCCHGFGGALEPRYIVGAEPLDQ